MKIYEKPVAEILRELQTSRVGISAREAEKRLKIDGKNLLEIRGEPLIKKIIQPFSNIMILVLAVAGILSLWHAEFVDAGIIFAIIFASAIIDWIQQFSTEKILRSLKKRENESVETYRDRKLENVNAENLVRGDVIILREGQKIPADARVISSDNLYVNESMLTGESMSVRKNAEILRGEKPIFERANILFSGSFVVAGGGAAVIFATGGATEFGQIARLASERNLVSPIQQKIAKLIKWTIISVFILAILAFLLEISRGVEPYEALKFILAFAVSAVPESLPIAITVVLALGMRKMAAKKALVRNMRAIENIGLTTVVATDKTGTLTKNELAVQQTFSPNFHENAFALQMSFALNNSESKIEDPLDFSLKNYLKKHKISLDARQNSRENLLKNLPFDYDFALSGNAWKFGEKTEIYLKGAPEKILARCKLTEKELQNLTRKLHEFAKSGFRVIAFLKFENYEKYLKNAENNSRKNVEFSRENSEIREKNSAKKSDEKFDKNHQKNFAEKTQTYQNENYKNEDFAEKISQKIDEKISEISFKNLPKTGAKFLGFAAISDELRPRVLTAVEDAQNAGVKVQMITGDHAETALAIARKTGIAENENQVFDAREILKIPEKNLAKIVRNARVFARVIPEAKFKILNELNKTEITAMTGDGVNDVPALARANTGIAMGAGAAIAKDAGDIVLLDNNFKSIISAIREGRIIISNVRRMLVYLLATNAGEVLTTLGALAIGLPLPVVAVQILWINLATDTFLVIPLGLEPGDKNIMKRPPANPRAPILSKFLISRIAVSALAMATITLAVFAIFLHFHSLDEARSAAFLVLIVIQWVNAFVLRGEISLLKLLRVKNRAFFAALFLTLILQILVMLIPPFRAALHLAEIHFDSLWACVISAILMALIMECHKFVGRKMRKNRENNLTKSEK